MTKTISPPMALVMKGGGVKGLAYVGAMDVLTKHYNFNWFVGTSAGAIAAILLGAGYSIGELEKILREKDFTDFFDAPWYQKLPNLAMRGGMNQASAFTHWIDDLLSKKTNKLTRTKLSDLEHRVTVYASRRGKGVLRFDSVDNDVDAAYAARCSMSIPFVFTPQSDQGIRTYDGGLQNNYPVNQLLTEHPDIQFISLFLGSETYEPIRDKSILYDLLSIATEASDADFVEKYRDRTVIIDPRPVTTLDFSLNDEEKQLLILSGRTGALAHLEPAGEEHARVRRERDELKLKVTYSRKSKKRRKTWRTFLGVAFFVLLSAFLLWWYVFRTPSFSHRQVIDSFQAGESFDLIHSRVRVRVKVQDHDVASNRIICLLVDGGLNLVRVTPVRAEKVDTYFAPGTSLLVEGQVDAASPQSIDLVDAIVELEHR